MCSSPNIPPPPPPPQAAKPADTAVLRDNAQRRRGGMAGGTMLTGTNAMASGANMGRATLLGQ